MVAASCLVYGEWVITLSEFPRMIILKIPFEIWAQG